MVGRLSMGVATCTLLAALLGAWRGGPRAAFAYEFWTRARSSGEAYQLRGFRILGGEVLISRRRFTQTLSLVLHDLGDLERDRRRAGRMPDRGPVVSWHSTLRLDHDFGTFVTGRLEAGPTRRQDALDLIPEIDESTFALDLLYGHLSIDDLFDGRLDIKLGRIVALDGTGSLPLDGLALRVAVATHVELRAGVGLAVRDHSPLGVAAYELDGPPGASCREYVEAEAGQAGRWQLIERSLATTDRRYSSDFEFCPQRQRAMPTLQLAIASVGLRSVRGELGYQIARSATVGVIGPVDRLVTPDLGLYPDESGQAPAWGTNLEQLHGSVGGQWRWGTFMVAPQALVRASLVHGVVDRAELEAAVQRGRHSWTPRLARFVPTFDTDSIWNAFAVDPSWDGALDYRYRGRWQGQATVWTRRYDGGRSAWAYGASTEMVRRLTSRMELSSHLLADAGYGGSRLAGDGDLSWRKGRARLAARGALTWARGDESASSVSRSADRLTATTAANATVQLSAGVAVHSMIELRTATASEIAVRALGVIDFAWETQR